MNPFLEAIGDSQISAPPSLVRPKSDPLTFGILASVGLHTLVIATSVCIGMVWTPKTDVYVTPPAMEVSMMVLPHGDRLPDKAMHTPRDASQKPKPVESSAPDKATAPPDPGNSDLTFEDPTKKPETKDDRSKQERDAAAKKREEAMRRMMMDDALADIDSPEGPRDRQATDPNSDATERIDLGGTGLVTDPEYAKYMAEVTRLLRANFHPLTAITQANPGLKTTVLIKIDVETGAVLDYDIAVSSKNASFDAAAMSATASVSTLPIPPEKFQARARSGLAMTFEPER
jgi:TonB family protein